MVPITNLWNRICLTGRGHRHPRGDGLRRREALRGEAHEGHPRRCHQLRDQHHKQGGDQRPHVHDLPRAHLGLSGRVDGDRDDVQEDLRQVRALHHVRQVLRVRTGSCGT